MSEAMDYLRQQMSAGDQHRRRIMFVAGQRTTASDPGGGHWRPGSANSELTSRICSAGTATFGDQSYPTHYRSSGDGTGAPPAVLLSAFGYGTLGFCNSTAPMPATEIFGQEVMVCRPALDGRSPVVRTPALRQSHDELQRIQMISSCPIGSVETPDGWLLSPSVVHGCNSNREPAPPPLRLHRLPNGRRDRQLLHDRRRLRRDKAYIVQDPASRWRGAPALEPPRTIAGRP